MANASMPLVYYLDTMFGFSSTIYNIPDYNLFKHATYVSKEQVFF
jgi:hypothetical protein